MSELVVIDGSMGGGQILRSALSLSMLTGRPFAIERIRSMRKKPGLMRQHLTAVRAAAQVCEAQVTGDELGSTRLTFQPGRVRAGSYHFAIPSAGSACLVLQTVLPALMVAKDASALSFEGGTHNPLAPPYPFLDQSFFPQLERMGVSVARSLTRVGYAPAGGGAFRCEVTPRGALLPLALEERGVLVSMRAEAHVSHVPGHVAERELEVVRARLALEPHQLHIRTPDSSGPGNVLLLVAAYEHVTEVVVGFGERALRAERVAASAVTELERYLASTAPVGEHLADQLLLPLALAGGSFRTLLISDHTRSNMALIRHFLPCEFAVTALDDGSFLVRVTKP